MASRDEVRAVYETELMSLVNEAHRVHQSHFPVGKVQLSSLLSIKTGGCPENCAYCPQSAHYETGVQKQSLMSVEDVRGDALRAKAEGATRFCMGAAWREVKDGPEFQRVLDMVRAVKAEGMEVCCTLGMLNEDQAKALKEAGLYAYNHNIDTSRAFYDKIISTRSYDDRLGTIENVRNAGITVCTGGILGMGESEADRVDFIWQLQNFSPHPESVTINTLISNSGYAACRAEWRSGAQRGARRGDGPHPDAEVDDPSERRQKDDERRSAVSVLLQRRQQHFSGRSPVDVEQSDVATGPRAF